MALHKMKNPAVDLRGHKQPIPGDDNGGTARSEHGRDFEERIKKMEAEGRQAARTASARKPPAATAEKESGATEKTEAVTDLRTAPGPVKPDNGSAGTGTESAGVVSAPGAARKKTAAYKFPVGFLWGTATSAYQVEGGIFHDWKRGDELNPVDIYNDWSVWEISPARRDYLFKKKLNLYDHICAMACDSYDRYEEDLDLAAGLKNNAIRFGLEWSRIELKDDVWDIKAINHYRDLMQKARARGMKTVVTLWHYTNPLWLAEEGGWTNEKAIGHFINFVDLVIRECGSLVDYWVTVNEPEIHVLDGYIRGKRPPNRKNIFAARKVFRNLVEAHNRAYELIHKHFPEAKVGIAKMVNFFEPARRWCPAELLIAETAHYFWNHLFLKKIKMDYIGLNYYFHDRIVWYPPFKKNKYERVTDTGWEIYPEGIYHALKYLRRFGKPVLITENGLADGEDKHRADFIREHLYWVHKAISEGVDVRGYFHWSLLDNFEWERGFGPKFGLYAVDRQTFKRTPRPSAKVYAEICRSNELKIKIDGD